MQSYVVTAATAKLFSFDELKDHLRFVETDDQADAVRKVKAAIAFCEQYTRRNFLTTVRRARLDYFPACSQIQLDFPPFQSVTSITYKDTSGTEQTLSTDVYGFDTDRGTIYLKNGKSWPYTLCETNAVTITFVTGWTDAESVPDDIKQAVLFAFGHNYSNREAVVNGSISAHVKMTVESYLAPWIAPRY